MWLDKFNEMRKKTGLSLDDLSRLSGIPKSTLTKISAGITQAPSLETIRALVYTMGYTLNDLEDTPSTGYSLTESELIKKYRLLDIYNKRLVNDVLDAAYNNMTRDINPEEQGITYLNCYELPAAAGTGEPLGSTYYTDKVQVPLNRVPENAHICIRVHGDSMEPAYHDGDIVMVQRLDGESVREGEIGIFVLNGEGYIKRLGDRELVSLNPAYDPIPIHDYDDLRCMGRVLAKV